MRAARGRPATEVTINAHIAPTKYSDHRKRTLQLNSDQDQDVVQTQPSAPPAPGACPFPRVWLAAIIAALAVLLPFVADAHVKWFSEYDYSRHVPIGQVFHNMALWSVLTMAAIAVWLFRAAETTALGSALTFRVALVQQRLVRLR